MRCAGPAGWRKRLGVLLFSDKKLFVALRGGCQRPAMSVGLQWIKVFLVLFLQKKNMLSSPAFNRLNATEETPLANSDT
jgi:hypothetical protein